MIERPFDISNGQNIAINETMRTRSVTFANYSGLYLLVRLGASDAPQSVEGADRICSPYSVMTCNTGNGSVGIHVTSTAPPGVGLPVAAASVGAAAGRLLVTLSEAPTQESQQGLTSPTTLTSPTGDMHLYPLGAIGEHFTLDGAGTTFDASGWGALRVNIFNDNGNGAGWARVQVAVRIATLPPVPTGYHNLICPPNSARDYYILLPPAPASVSVGYQVYKQSQDGTSDVWVIPSLVAEQKQNVPSSDEALAGGHYDYQEQILAPGVVGGALMTGPAIISKVTVKPLYMLDKPTVAKWWVELVDGGGALQTKMLPMVIGYDTTQTAYTFYPEYRDIATWEARNYQDVLLLPPGWALRPNSAIITLGLGAAFGYGYWWVP